MDRRDDQIDGIDVGDDGLGADTVPEIVPPALTVAYARGVNPGKWARIWSERRPEDELRLIRVDLDEQRAVLVSGAADVVLARVPIDQDGLNTIALFEELPVVVFAKGAALGAEDTVGMAALADEQLIMTPLVLEWAERAAVLGFDAPAAPLTDDPEAAVELAASEVGIVVVPQSVARLHQRKDVEYRPIVGLPSIPVVLVWPQDREDEAVEEFIGIVRGRTANSSRRSAPTEQAAAPAPQQDARRRKAPKAGSTQGTAAGTSRGAQLAARKAKQEELARERRKKRKGR
ncbi:LysR family transcriptional regulator [Plantibacter sp. PA-3-X8]|uniref:LysR family substrate-binding domain-containing protein n=1 Tax=Plantibacter sp. PA-3-X8 TaxID=2480625 RepID=UPI000F5F014C|nr:LysR family substrate-binding domain-containing protein [Plantibacter sp. PA-3-X8]AZH84331.1 LysR family transcriptional regulator [Plantibacter sp. PA-3-X8]